MKKSFFLPIIIISGCSLSPSEQSKLDLFPECENTMSRWNSLSSSLTQGESNCIVTKEKKLQKKVDYENFLKEKQKEEMINNEKIKNEEFIRKSYESSLQGVSDKLLCNRLMKKSLENLSYIDFEIKGYSRTLDGFVSCVGYVNYKGFTGIRMIVRVIIYNESNDMFKIYDK